MNSDIVGNNPFDGNDPINQGVVSDEIVSISVGVTVRRGFYQDPYTCITYKYLINLPPSIYSSIVALLDKSRWEVEKVFDEFKNKLGKTKSWASTTNAKTCQARLLCLTHNLLTLMEEQIFREPGIRNEAETTCKAKNLFNRDKDSKIKGYTGLTLLQKNHPATHSAHREVHPLVEKLFGYRAHLSPSVSPSLQDLCPLMRPMLDTVGCFLIDKARNSNLLAARRFHSKDWNHTGWHKPCRT